MALIKGYGRDIGHTVHGIVRDIVHIVSYIGGVIATNAQRSQQRHNTALCTLRHLRSCRLRGRTILNGISKAVVNHLGGREPAAAATIFGHERSYLLDAASRVASIYLRDALICLAQQLNLGLQLLGITLNRAERVMDEIERCRGDKATPLACRLCHDGGSRGGIAIAAGGDMSTRSTQRLVDKHGIVDIATRRAYIHTDIGVAQVGNARHTLLEPLIGSNAVLVVVELPRLREAYSTLDVDRGDLGLVVNLDC